MGCASSTPDGEASAPAPRLSQREREQKKPSTCGSLVWNDVAQGTLQLIWTENDPVRAPPKFDRIDPTPSDRPWGLARPMPLGLARPMTLGPARP